MGFVYAAECSSGASLSALYVLGGSRKNRLRLP
jgi:hypothetical protein